MEKFVCEAVARCSHKSSFGTWVSTPEFLENFKNVKVRMAVDLNMRWNYW